jgi:hypothetical protein
MGGWVENKDRADEQRQGREAKKIIGKCEPARQLAQLDKKIHTRGRGRGGGPLTPPPSS